MGGDISGVGSNSWSPSDLGDMAASDLSQSCGTDGLQNLQQVFGDLSSTFSDLGNAVKQLGQDLQGFANDLTSMFSDPGALTPPNQQTCSGDGYSSGTASSPTDTGPIGNPPAGATPSPSQSSGTGSSGGTAPSSGTDSSNAPASSSGSSGASGASGTDSSSGASGTDGSSGASGASGADDPSANDMGDMSFMKDPTMSVEDKIFTLLMKIEQKDEKSLDKMISGLGSAPKQADLAKLQKAQSDMANITSLMGNMQAKFDHMKEGIIQNIR